MTSSVGRVQQLTAEVPDGVMDAAWARMTAERCPEANAACDTAGVQRCGHRLDAALTVAFNAGRESADIAEWGMRSKRSRRTSAWEVAE